MSIYGNFIEIDLADSRVKTREIECEDIRLFFGGGGIGAKIFMDIADDGAIVIANGLLTGFPVPTACKTSVIFRSPLTGIFGETSVGGMFGAEMKKAGVDGLILRGEAPSPVYIYIEGGNARICDAATLWGMDTFETHRKLSEELPAGASIGCIGPAGENGVRFASVMFEGEFPRAAGRTGVGCAMGLKHVKAIAAKGEKPPEPFHKKRLSETVREINASVREKARTLHEAGTARSVASREKSGDLPIKNFSQGRWEGGAARITGMVYAEKMHLRHSACFRCPIACAKRIEIRDGDHRGLITSQPEYETVAALGSNLLIDSPEEIAVLNMLCNRFGIDTISTGVVISFLFECRERGIVTEEDYLMKDFPFIWGNTAAVRELIRLMAVREGIGEILADGVREAARRFGGGAERYAMHAKGLELPMHDPRALVSSAATYATGNRGGSHNESFAYYVEQGVKIEGMGFPDTVDPHASLGKGELTAKMQNLSSLYDSLGLCKFLIAGGVGVNDLVSMVNLTAGWKLLPEDILMVGDRIYTLKRIYNQRLGLGGDDDILPERIVKERKGDGDAADVLPDIESMKRELYEYRGWDSKGAVTPEKARSLGIEKYLA